MTLGNGNDLTVVKTICLGDSLAWVDGGRWHIRSITYDESGKVTKLVECCKGKHKGCPVMT